LFLAHVNRSTACSLLVASGYEILKILVNRMRWADLLRRADVEKIAEDQNQGGDGEPEQDISDLGQDDLNILRKIKIIYTACSMLKSFLIKL